MIITRTTAALAGIGLALSLSACSSAEDTTEANAAFCQSSAATQVKVAKLKTLVTSDGTVEQVQAQREAIAKAVETSAADAKDLTESVQAEVKAADEAFDAAIGAIPADTPVSDASAQYQAAVVAWDKAVLSIRTEVGCK